MAVHCQPTGGERGRLPKEHAFPENLRRAPGVGNGPSPNAKRSREGAKKRKKTSPASTRETANSNHHEEYKMDGGQRRVTCVRMVFGSVRDRVHALEG